MNILLINPTGGPLTDYGALAKATPELPLLGLASLATVLTEKGHKVRIVDLHVDELGVKDIVSIVGEGNYSVVGFSVYVTTIKNTLAFAGAIKDEHPGVIICVGGPQATLDPDFFNQSFIDYVFRGEADFTFADFIDTLKNGRKIDHIKGCLKNESGSLKGSKELSLVDNLDDIPFLEVDKFYDLKKFHQPAQVRGRKAVNVLSVRGCPFQCTFCAAASITGRKLRNISVGRFVDNLERLRSKGFDSFMIYDDTFTVNKKRAVAIAEEIIRRKLNMVWNCWSRADCVDEETLSVMRKSGCYLVMYGFESFNDKTLKRLKKGFTAEQCLKAVEVTKKAGMIASASFMIGLPGETKEDILNTINAAAKTRLDIGIFGIFEPYEGTPIYQDCVSSGRWIKSKYKNRLLLDQEEVWVPDTLSREEIEKLTRMAFNKFYLRASYVKSFLKMLWHLNWERKLRLISTGLDYFIFQRLFSTAKNFVKGSRFR
ncbi:MAG: radical SAM protein [Armatimonadota bacterium]